jgi:hypothetical protein
MGASLLASVFGIAVIVTAWRSLPKPLRDAFWVMLASFLIFFDWFH